MTEQVQPRRSRHHRRSPAKRFLLATGPFILLIGAFLLSAGVVQIIEQVPDGPLRPTLAEERRNAPVDESARASTSSAAPRMPSIPGSMLEGSDYDLEKQPAESALGQDRALGCSNYGLAIADPSDPSELGVASDERLGSRPASRDFELR